MRFLRRSYLSVAVIALALTTARPSAAQFTPGNLAVLQVGDGVAGLTSAATPISIGQFTITGTPVGSPLVIPSTGAGALTLSGSATSEGALSLSANGQWLTFGGFNTAAGTTGVATTASATVPRAAVRIDSTASVGFSTLADSFDGSDIRSAISTNGSDFWVAGNAGSGLGATAGPRYHVYGSGAATQLSSVTTNRRVIGIFGGQLYTTSASGTLFGVTAIGTGVPTTTGQASTLLPGFPTATASPYAFVGIDNPLNPVAGVDTFYVADDRAAASGGGLQRWVFDGSNWTLSATVAGTTGLRGLTASLLGTTVSLYATTTETSANRLVSINDLLSASGGTFDPSFVTLATAPTNTAFRGVAFTPTPVPEPASVVGIALGGLVVGGWIRRRKA
ncbi:MAG: PEP-CTERM sorting domain-containing protein [Gemmataceae bacterium]